MKSNKSAFFIEINNKEGEKLKISPTGTGVQGLDGRTYDIDGKAIAEYQHKQGLDIPLDENHYGSRAQGWIALDSIEVREDGIYASIEYTPEGQALVDNKSYRYLSPSFIMGEARNVLGIESVGLVNTPNLLNTAINYAGRADVAKNNGAKNIKEQIEMTPEEVSALVEEKLQAMKEQLLAELKPEDAQKAADEAKAAVEEIKELKDELLEANKQTRAGRIEAAIQAGKIAPNQRDFALSLSNSQFAEFEKVNGLNLEHLKKGVDIEKNAKGQPDEVDAKIAEMLGL